MGIDAGLRAVSLVQFNEVSALLNPEHDIPVSRNEFPKPYCNNLLYNMC
jgi:hypothetical protein